MVVQRRAFTRYRPGPETLKRRGACPDDTLSGGRRWLIGGVGLFDKSYESLCPIDPLAKGGIVYVPFSALGRFTPLQSQQL
jgi:hypothetical protein